MDDSQSYLGDRVMRMWMRSVWKRLGTERSAAPTEIPLATPGLTLTACREGRLEPLVLLASQMSLRTVSFRTPDPLVLGERLFLRLRLPGLQLELAARVTQVQGTSHRAELESPPEGLSEMSRLLERLAAAA